MLSLPKVGASLSTAIVPCPSAQLLPKLVTPSVTNEDVTFPHAPSHLKFPVPTVSRLEFVLLRSICFELFAFASKVKASYNFSKLVVRKTSCSACGHLQDLNHVLLDCLASESLQIYLWLCSLHIGVWLNCWVSAKFRCFFISRKGLGGTTPQSSRFKNKNNAVCCTDC